MRTALASKLVGALAADGEARATIACSKIKQSE